MNVGRISASCLHNSSNWAFHLPGSLTNFSTQKLVKAADKISAYLKCLEEEGYGNQEFMAAKQNIEASIRALDLPEVNDFMDQFAPSFKLPLDALN